MKQIQKGGAILEINKVVTKDSELTKEELYEYLKSYEVHREIKKLILKSMNINEDDLDNCVELIVR